MDGCPFRFVFKSGFNSPAKVLALQWKIIYHQLLSWTVDTLWFDLM